MEYFDIDGNPTTLEKLVTEQPAWACSRIRADRERIEKLSGIVVAKEQRIEEMEAALREIAEEERAFMSDPIGEAGVTHRKAAIARKALEDG